MHAQGTRTDDWDYPRNFTSSAAPAPALTPTHEDRRTSGEEWILFACGAVLGLVLSQSLLTLSVGAIIAGVLLLAADATRETVYEIHIAKVDNVLPSHENALVLWEQVHAPQLRQMCDDRGEAGIV